MGEADQSLQALLRFLYRAPIAVVQALRDGTIEMMTPLATNWLLPMAAADRASLDNLFDVLDRFDPGLRGLAAADSGAQAALCEGRLVSVDLGGRPPTVYALDMVALDRSRVMVLLNDVTRQEQRAEADRRMTRQHLAEMAALSEQALETMAVAVARESPDAGPVRLDARWRRWLGLPADRDSLSPAEFAARIHPDDRPAYERDHAKAAAGQQAGFSDFRLRRGDGSWARISGRRFLAPDAAGAGPRLNTFAFDVTEQRAAERERLALAEQLNLAAVATGIGSFEWRRRERELLWFGPGQAVFGGAGPGPEGAARWLERALPPHERARLLAWLRTMLHRRSGGDLEFEIVRPDGSRRWLAVKAQPRLDGRGAVASLIGVAWDVSERRAGEAALEARHQAEQANRAKSEFLSRMSHELRTPLNAILGFSEVMLRSPEIGALPRQKHRLDQIHDAGRHLLQLIDDLLDVSRIEIGALQLELASVDLAECARAACLAVQQQARLRRVTITIEPPPRPAHVRADPTRLRQVLLNLLSNAVKYNREQGRVELRFEPTEHGWLTCVSDTGIGLSDSQIGRLYAPYDRLGRESGSVQGVGIGLTITRQFVLAMGGRIDVRSEAGSGTCFCVELPAAAPPEAAADGAGHEALTRSEPRGRLLAVEDNEADAALLRTVLEWRPGIELDIAANAHQALDLAGRARPDLLLLDMVLPDLPGTELLRLLRADPALRDLPCIVVSAAAMAEQAEAARAAGADAYLTKPVAAGTLLGAIDRLLGAGSAPG